MENRFGKNLRFLRKRQKITLEKLGESLKISKSAISDYEIGKTFPPLDVCDLISAYFNINLDDLKNSNFSELSEEKLEEVLNAKQSPKIDYKSSEDFSNEKKQLEFHNKLLSQQIEGLQIQLQLVKQIVESKDSEIKSLQIQVRLLEEKLNG
ncbi:helix-turn-helix domain protein [Emticicia oligotrophica DSM 17448]|uniref:Helix-turn-helix domain protein n=1 Tax=Emticicia oligotrophica (strain DSM 17448 / CIP 109782 / MTCC 6937 / GPTSA100-15) TaxID=929562 RepID=A0ABM5MYH3_EMTOG|nr:helix-turn-helix transcriptional regulator [Emticicia oligotrophica]AFK02204.1 helix-turn-helix domain protein [Emticicia oligotrophica DSM 17448]